MQTVFMFDPVKSPWHFSALRLEQIVPYVQVLVRHNLKPNEISSSPSDVREPPTTAHKRAPSLKISIDAVVRYPSVGIYVEYKMAITAKQTFLLFGPCVRLSGHRSDEAAALICT